MSGMIPAGYKQTDVGVLPEEWEVLELGAICSKIQDGNYGEAYPKSHEFIGYGIPAEIGKVLQLLASLGLEIIIQRDSR